MKEIDETTEKIIQELAKKFIPPEFKSFCRECGVLQNEMLEQLALLQRHSVAKFQHTPMKNTVEQMDAFGKVILAGGLTKYIEKEKTKEQKMSQPSVQTIYFFVPPPESSESPNKSHGAFAKPVFNTTIINNHFLTPQSMDASTIAKTAYSVIRPFVGKNKAINQITSEIKEAANTSLLELWETIKPIFIEEFEKDDRLTDKAEKEEIAVHEIEKRIDKDSVLKSNLEQRLQVMERQQRGNPTIIGSDNILNTGDIRHTQGDVIIGGAKFSDPTKS